MVAKGAEIFMSELERERERMMYRTADDLPFGAQDNRAKARTWFLIAVGLVLALAIPLMYVVIGLAGAAVSSSGAWAFVLASALLLVTFVGLSAYVYARTARRVPMRDDVGKLMQARKGKGMDVKSVMRPDPVICGDLDSIYECAKIMYKSNVGFLVVLDAKDRCVGVVTDRDLVCGGLAQDVDASATPVTTVAEREVSFVRPDHSLEDCLHVMRDQGVRRVPVLDGDRLVGIVSVDDLIARRVCSIDDLAPIFARQLEEPHLLSGEAAA